MVVKESNAMDLTKTELYQTLTECSNSENADQVFRAHLAVHVEPHVVGVLTAAITQRDVSALFIKLIQACDYLASEVPEAYTTSLYDSLCRLSSEEISSLTEEFGENEIGRCIQRAKNVKWLRPQINSALSGLLSKHARHVQIRPHDGQAFEDPEHLEFDKNVSEDWDYELSIPETWVNLKSIKCTNSNVYVHINAVHPKLETVEVTNVYCSVEQPSVTTLIVDDCGVCDKEMFPNARVEIVDS